MRFSLLFAAIFTLTACSKAPSSPDFSNGVWVDLTHEFDNRTLHWPTSDLFVLSTVSEGMTEEGYYYSAYAFQGSEHGGTHLDAPIHFQAEGKTTDEIPLDALIGPAIVIDVSAKAAADRGYGITISDITDWEAEHGEIHGRPILLFNTGSAALWPDAKAYLGTGRRGPGGVAELNFPGIRPETAEFLVTERSVRAVGLDTPSLDMANSASYLTHRILFDQNIPGFENVASLDGIPAKGATVIALPMKIAGGSGGPLRIVAFVPN